MKVKQSKLGIFLLLTTFLSSICCVGFVLWKETHHFSKIEKTIARKQKNEGLLMEQVASSLDQVMKSIGKNLILYPPQLKSVPCSRQLGIVKEVRKVEIESVFAPYNPSIIEKEDGGYHLFFRYDQPKDSWKTTPFYSKIGYCECDSQFSIQKTVEAINTGSEFSEDPRIARVGKNLFLSWNDTFEEANEGRCIYVGEWNQKKCKLEYSTALKQSIKPVEKNWMPFEKTEGSSTSLAFVYGIYPHKIIEVSNPKYNQITHLVDKGYSALHKMNWSNLWGALSGGTTARLIGKEYISFFHSSFKHKEKIWYVMGAYTFEEKAPHKITSVTPYPILFPGIYTSDILNTADPNKFCIFPAGIAVEHKNNKIFLHVSCGENDSCIKIVTIDYEKLKKNMVSVD